MIFSVSELISMARNERASDIHLVCGRHPMCRVDGRIKAFADYDLTPDICVEYAKELTGDRYSELQRDLEIDLAGTFDGVRVRINVYCQRNGYSAALRILSDKIPELSALGLPPVVDTFANLPRGIVLVTGETGSGKSTTLAALLDRINKTKYEHILTLEDPVEYVYTPDKCIINQREIGQDTKTYAAGLRAALREDPDVILVGEMRDVETIEIALTAAETGHLVFSTLHTGTASDSIDRIVNVFPAERQGEIRMQLSMTLKAALAQQLIPKASGKGRICACEVMLVNAAIKNLIREGKTPQIANSIATSGAEGAVTMDNALIRLCKTREISPEAAVNAAVEADYVKRNLMMR